MRMPAARGEGSVGAAAGAGAAWLYPGAALRADRGSSTRPFELTSFCFAHSVVDMERNEAVEAALRMLVATGGPAGESSEASGSRTLCASIKHTSLLTRIDLSPF